MRAKWRAFAAAWKLALRIAGLSFRAELEYRANFVTNVIFGIAWQSATIIFATVLLSSFQGMGGWSSHQVLLIVSMRTLSHGLYALIFDRNYLLEMLIQDGRLETFLLRPMRVYRQIQLAVFPTSAIGDLLVGVSMFTWAVSVSGLHWTPTRIAYLASEVIGGMLMEAAMATTLAGLLLRYPATMAWNAWIEDLAGTFGSYPLNIFPRPITSALTFVLPLAFIAYFPAAVLTRHTGGLNVPAAVAAAAPLICLGAYVCTRLLWNARLRRYTGVTG
jgi:ABC-2 type transport system permease protein